MLFGLICSVQHILLDREDYIRMLQLSKVKIIMFFESEHYRTDVRYSIDALNDLRETRALFS